ncbi:hypothetical protein Pfo_017408 [Paulownia fortunei]|nr:hypothetical protein Pfo_017408 [Paulownia fortunei]
MISGRPLFYPVAPTNDPANSIYSPLKSTKKDNYFELTDGKLSVRNVPLLTDIPSNVTFNSFSSVCDSSDAPLSLFQRAQSLSFKGRFLGFSQHESGIFRFKTWWSTQWVGKSVSDIQMETQWVMLDVPEIRSYVVIIPIVEGKFRSALHPGFDGHVLICAESGSTKVKESSFDAIAYVHVSEYPYTLMKEAYTAIRVHLNTFKLIEEKSAPALVNKFGWCTWDAFYLTVEPAGIWHGHQSDGQDANEDVKKHVLGGTQMTARLQGGSMTGPNLPPFDPKKPKMLISKAIEIEIAEKSRDKAAVTGVTDLSQYDFQIQKLKEELDELFGWGDEEEGSSKGCASFSCKSENFGMKAFTRNF